MPATQRGQAYRLGPNRWGLRYYDTEGRRRRRSPFPSRSAALAYFRDVIEPELRGEPPPPPELTLAEFVDLFLERHAANVRPKTIAALRWRLGVAVAAFGGVPLRELERMSGELAEWRRRLPVRSRYMAANPAREAGPNRQPPPRPVRAFTTAELEAIAAELSPRYRPLPA